jgi:hypothetical protein
VGYRGEGGEKGWGSMSLFHTLSNLEANDDFHLSRLLILLGAFSGKDGTGTIGGLAKLARLDFLLKYPVCLEQTLEAKEKSAHNVEVLDYERKSIESSMVRFRYSPWDFRYRRFINLLVAKGLATVNVKGKTVEVGLTSNGLQAVNALSGDEAFNDTVHRAKLLRTDYDE